MCAWYLHIKRRNKKLYRRCKYGGRVNGDIMNKEYNDSRKKMDFKYFVTHNKVIHNKYGDCYVAIRNKDIIGVFFTEDEAIEVSSLQYGFGNFIVQKCTGNKEGYTQYIDTTIKKGN